MMHRVMEHLITSTLGVCDQADRVKDLRTRGLEFDSYCSTANHVQKCWGNISFHTAAHPRSDVYLVEQQTVSLCLKLHVRIIQSISV